MSLSEGILLVTWAVGFGITLERLEDVRDQHLVALILVVAASWPVFFVMAALEVARGEMKVFFRLIGTLVVIFAVFGAFMAVVR